MDCKSTHTPTPRKSAKAILKIQLPQEPTGENNVNVKIIDGIFFFFFFENYLECANCEINVGGKF